MEAYRVFEGGDGFLAREDRRAACLRESFHPRGEVHGVGDHGPVHPVRLADVAQSERAGAGYLVWSLYMPLVDQQPSGVAVSLPSFGELTVREHRQMACLDEITDGHPPRHFIESRVAAHVDPRIDASYPVAGGLPLGLRFDRPRCSSFSPTCET